MIIEFIKRTILNIKSQAKLKNFKNNCIFGSGFKCTSNSNCFNESGSKQNICIGDNCMICGIIRVDETGRIKIGEYTTIRYNSEIGSTNFISIGSHVIISNNVTIIDNNNHPINPEIRYRMCESGFENELWKWKYAISKPVIIKDNVWIGEHSAVLKGVTIGEGSIVAMHSVVTKDVPPYTIVAGNPAKVVKKLK